MQLLIQRGADLKRDWEDETPLHWAGKEGRNAVIRVLLENGMDINIRSRCLRDTALHRACIFGHESTVRLLLEQGAATTIKDEAGHTPHDIVTVMRLDKHIQGLLKSAEEKALVY